MSHEGEARRIAIGAGEKGEESLLVQRVEREELLLVQRREKSS